MTDLTTPAAVAGSYPELHNAIWRASFSKDLASLSELLAAGADVCELANTHAARDSTVLHSAANSSVEIVDLLLEHGAAAVLESKCGPGEEGRWAGHTPLQMAAKMGRTDIATRLLEHGARLDAFSAAALGNIEHLSEPKQRDDYRATLLHWAVTANQRATAAALIELGAEIDARDSFGETPLLLAAERRAAQEDIVRIGRQRRLLVSFVSLVDLLLGKGAVLDPFSAAALGDARKLQDFLDGDASLACSTNCHRVTPLHWAARNGHVDTARMLLEFGADINARDAIGCPPLWYAAHWARNAEMTFFLCQQGADVYFRNIWDKGIEAYDCGYGCMSIIQNSANPS